MMTSFRKRVCLIVVLIGRLVVIDGLDTSKNDCMVCSQLNDKECLALLDSNLDALSDKNRLSFLRAVFTGAFMTASHQKQTEEDAIQTCSNLSDKQCLIALDDQMKGLEDKTRLSYLAASCNILQHWSAFSSSPTDKSNDGPLQTLSVAASVLGLTAITVAVAASVVFVKRTRSRRDQYKQLTAEFDFDFELEV